MTTSSPLYFVPTEEPARPARMFNLAGPTAILPSYSSSLTSPATSVAGGCIHLGSRRDIKCLVCLCPMTPDHNRGPRTRTSRDILSSCEPMSTRIPTDDHRYSHDNDWEMVNVSNATSLYGNYRPEYSNYPHLSAYIASRKNPVHTPFKVQSAHVSRAGERRGKHDEWWNDDDDWIDNI